MKSMPLISVVILNWNGIADTKRCLSSLSKTHYPNLEVVVLDNGSNKREDLILKKIYPTGRFRFYRSDTNLGFSGGCNTMAHHCGGTYMVLLNNDTIVTPDWLEPLVRTAQHDPLVAVIQPKILWLKDRKKFDYAGACGGFIDVFGHMFTRGRIFETKETDRGQYDIPMEIFWACGAAFFVKKKMFDQLVGFDEDFFNYSEEVDFCWRAKKLGFKIYSQPESIIYHNVASTAQHNLPLKRYLEHRNNLFVLLKNYPWQLLVVAFPCRLIFEVVSIGYYVARKDYHFARSTIKSFIQVFLNGKKMLRRRTPQGTYNFLHDPSVYKGSIAIQYFLRSRHAFTQIFT